MEEKKEHIKKVKMPLAGEKQRNKLPGIDNIKIGPQRLPEDFRIFNGTPSEFFKKAAEDLEKHEKEVNE